MTFKRVVVTGLGALTPIGNTYQEYWEGLKAGKSGAASITKFDTTLFKTKFACEVKNFEIGNFMDRKEARKLDLFAQYAMVSADEAVKDSNLPLQELNPDRVGVIWGSGIGGLITFSEEVKSFAKGDGTPRFNPFFIPKM
ncbi:MAG: beta-ketoacyl synthase N-terminal-like domain-containing protein, partial [Cyclobacteriaceae bacterium]|nr:beta-ketoacyl synthase N-terminal-like domain-containing protein [Cyclobacteriaceae bacterium]